MVFLSLSIVSCARNGGPATNASTPVRNVVLEPDRSSSSSSASIVRSQGQNQQVPFLPQSAWEDVRINQQASRGEISSRAESSKASTGRSVERGGVLPSVCDASMYTCSGDACETSSPDCTFEDLARTPMGALCGENGGTLFAEGTTDSGGRLRLTCRVGSE